MIEKAAKQKVPQEGAEPSSITLTDCRIVTAAGQGLGIIERAAIFLSGDEISWIGPQKDLPKIPKDSELVSLSGRWVTPGLIDCHTHLAFAGNRAHEFELRLQGASYEEIAAKGGGILSTVTATRNSSLEDLVRENKHRLQNWLQEGVTSLEIKSGYGLDLQNERKQLTAASRLAQELDLTIHRTCLAAHALPPEFAGNKDGYIDLVAREILPQLAQESLIDSVDAFCERIAFSPEQVARVFDGARSLGLPVRIHAEQLSDSGGARLAARYHALSADHLEYLTEADCATLAEAGTIAVLLPGAYYALREKRCPPIDSLRRYNVPMAIASDANPGSSPVLSFLPMLNMACTLFNMTPEEALLGVTRNAARALGLEESRGSLAPGKKADIAIWDIERPAELSYWIGGNPCSGVLRAGRWRKRQF